MVPFLNWLRTLTPDDDYSIDLFYSVPTEADAVYLPELTAHGVRLPSVRMRSVFTRTQGHLPGGDVIDAVAVPAAGVHAFLCGPAAMVSDITRDLRRRGVPRDYIHAEQFSFR